MKTMNLKFATLLTILFINTISFSQKKERPTEKMDPEKIAELRIKKMTLELDLTEKQQKEIKPFLLKQAEKVALKKEEIKTRKEKNEKLSTDERFEIKNESLDFQIEMKNKLKETLTTEQFEKWEKTKQKAHHNRKKHKKSNKHIEEN